MTKPQKNKLDLERELQKCENNRDHLSAERDSAFKQLGEANKELQYLKQREALNRDDVDSTYRLAEAYIMLNEGKECQGMHFAKRIKEVLNDVLVRTPV